MALDQQILINSLENLTKKNPSTIGDAAEKWSKMFVEYGTSAMAGATVPAFNEAVFKGAILAGMASGKMMEVLGGALVSFWQTAVWAGPGFTGVTSAVLPLNTSEIGNKIANNEIDDVATYLAQEIDKWTKTIKVTLTNINSGVTSIVTIS